MGGQGPSYGSLIIKLKNWEERSTMQNSTIVYATLYMRAQKIIKEAQVLFFAPPMIPGYSASSDIELNMQDKTGGDLNHFFDVVNNYNAALEARPEINSAKTSFNPHFPQYQLDIDAAACKKAGISPNDILTTLQGYYGGLYASNFNSFGKMYRVMVQAEPRCYQEYGNTAKHQGAQRQRDGTYHAVHLHQESIWSPTSSAVSTSTPP
ncbi:efflux RND transporter permease subunit [Bacteroides uniformis]|nr:efflux RND transporter permease subunit [Bacteroides uniformis]